MDSPRTEQPPGLTDAVRAKAAQWLAEHGDALYRVALGRTRNPDVARDLVQETLLAGMKHWAKYSGQSSEAGWLMGILRTKVVDHFRQQAREQNFTDLEFLADEVERFFNKHAAWNPKFGPKPWPQPDESMEITEFWRAFDNCVSKLPPKVAQVFLLRELDGMDSAAICKEFGVSPNNFWVMLYRARLGLRRCLEENWFKRDEK
jgi:RNA polymerase sigma-70 factor (ECF subfamily)